MKKRFLTLFLCLAMAFCMVCPSAFAVDSETVSGCDHEWFVPSDHYYSIPIPGEDLNLGVEVEQCSKCGLYKHTADYLVGKSTYYSLLPPHYNGLIPSELLTYWGNKWFDFFGKNATATKAPSGIGRKDLPGYADDNGTPSVNNEGGLTFVAKYRFSNDNRHFVDSFSITDTNNGANKIWHFGQSSVQIESYSEHDSHLYVYGGYVLDTQNISGIFYIPKGTTFVYNPWGDYDYHNIGFGWKSFETDSFWSHSCDGSKQYLILYRYNNSTKKPDYMYSSENGIDVLFYQSSHLKCIYISEISSDYPDDLLVYCHPTNSTVNKQANITINNNTWNGNIYTDNSTNLTYIYPQYTTINEKNETVTNISNTPIIYNNETKQYYTYDQTTKNYYYITYNADPAPSPTPTPNPTDKPGGSISTPETGKPGGSSGNGQSWWDKLLDKIGNAVIDGLLGAVSAVLKLIFKLFSTILGWIIWAVSLVFTLFPFLPPGVSGLLVGGVVVCFVIGIIKFIRG